MKHLRGEKRFYYGMTVLVLVFIIAGLTSNLEGGVRGNRQEKEAFDQKPEEVQTEQENQGEETQVVSNPNIRVLLMTDGYKNTIHPSVTVSSTSGLSITYGETVEECEARMEVTFMPDDSRFQSGNIRIQAKEGEITVNSLKRGYGIPSYQGILELRTTAEGIAIINELPVENYLCRVVPSEMPSGYEIEALKAQIGNILDARMPILYAGVMSCGVAYTLQILGQKHANPAIASLLLSMESCFSVLSGWIILGETLSAREGIGCVLMFVAIILAQLPDKREKLKNGQA